MCCVGALSVKLGSGVTERRLGDVRRAGPLSWGRSICRTRRELLYWAGRRRPTAPPASGPVRPACSGRGHRGTVITSCRRVGLGRWGEGLTSAGAGQTLSPGRRLAVTAGAAAAPSLTDRRRCRQCHPPALRRPPLADSTRPCVAAR